MNPLSDPSILKRAKCIQIHCHFSKSHHHKLPYLIEVRPKGADGELCLHPAFSDDPGHVPDRVPLRPAVHLHVDVQGPWAGSVAAGEVVMEIYAVGVILL